jgi:hypothetical protein
VHKRGLHELHVAGTVLPEEEHNRTRRNTAIQDRIE